MDFFSDMDVANPGVLCGCGLPAVNMIEWEADSGYRWWASYCAVHRDEALARQAEAYAASQTPEAIAEALRQEAEEDAWRAAVAQQDRDYALLAFAAAVERAEALEPIPAYWPLCAVAGEW